MTLGKRGCDLYNGGGKRHFPTYEKIRPVDTVGAGDCFTGSFAAGLKVRGSLEGAIELATAAASLGVLRRTVIRPSLVLSAMTLPAAP